LLAGRRATTHWRFAEDVTKTWPDIHLDPNAIYVKDGGYYTSAGISAGIDLALALVEEDLGNKVALAVARELVVYFKRSGGQLQYSAPLRFQTRSTNGFSEAVAWIQNNLRSNLSAELLAEQMHLSTRQLSRRFKATFGLAPAAFVEVMRLDESRWLIANAELSMDGIAAAVGYGSTDTFRRAFERRFAITPQEYRARFGETPSKERVFLTSNVAVQSRT
jgi:transcriptional regulator GlxA family with amidase domain